MGPGKAGLRFGGEGFPPLPDHLRGDGFSGDPATQATLASLRRLTLRREQVCNLQFTDP